MGTTSCNRFLSGHYSMFVSASGKIYPAAFTRIAMKGERGHRSAALEWVQGGLNVELERQTMEIERQVASESAQSAGAGGGHGFRRGTRETVEPLMEEATLSIGTVEVQDGRGAVGRHSALSGGVPPGRRIQPPRADRSGAVQPGRGDARGQAPNDRQRHPARWSTWTASYENGRMVFQVTINLMVQVSALDTVSVITQAAGIPAAGGPVRRNLLHQALPPRRARRRLLRESVALPAQAGREAGADRLVQRAGGTSVAAGPGRRAGEGRGADRDADRNRRAGKAGGAGQGGAAL